uniref:NADH-ubiquinone oxidoreductase chain 3 n=1 Tax=Zorotypus medoensis TaxID=1264643 RepID=A0A0A7C4F7_9NEOP|nr:NADH dehydrogenase subunit 3 [Zorotypus medoensis]AFY30508.1 NADH dehydrogenase subunit 3 [Zorotypus medoensis]AHY35146.1 NADH dehydrogenase subunit 3 [Zorotypus medoensis]
MLMIIPLLISMTIMITLLIAHSMMATKNKYNREKLSPFECGFDPMCHPRLPFSLQFFIITILFLIFDAEISIIIPSAINTNNLILPQWFFNTLFFCLLMILGLAHEWMNNSLEWEK